MLRRKIKQGNGYGVGYESFWIRPATEGLTEKVTLSKALSRCRNRKCKCLKELGLKGRP